MTERISRPYLNEPTGNSVYHLNLSLVFEQKIPISIRKKIDSKELTAWFDIKKICAVPTPVFSGKKLKRKKINKKKEKKKKTFL